MNENPPLSSLTSFLRPRTSHHDTASSPLFSASDYSFGEDDVTKEEPTYVSVGEFLSRFRDHGSESLCNAYEASHPHNTAFHSGAVTTTLCEDVFSLVDLQVNALHDYVAGLELLKTKTGDTVLIDGLSFVFRNLWYKQRQYRDNFLLDLSSSCAAANDFLRMVERAESLVEHLKERYDHLQWERSEVESTEDPRVAGLSEKMADLVRLYSGDAVIAAQRVHVFLFQSVNRSSIKSDMFSRNWEELTHNQLTLSLVKTVEDYLSDSQQYLCNEFLCVKAIDAAVKATVCFYVRCLVLKADTVRHKMRNLTSHGGRLAFKNPARALTRMMYDIDIIQDYFRELAKDSSALSRLVEQEVSVLIAIHEFLGVAVGKVDAESLEHLIIVLHKKTGGSLMVTTYLLEDMWFLFAPAKDKKSVCKTIEVMKPDLHLVSKRMKEMEPRNQASNQNPSRGLMLDEMLKDIYEERRLQEAKLCGHVIRSFHDDEPPVEMGQETDIESFKEISSQDHSMGSNDWIHIAGAASPEETEEMRKGTPIHSLKEKLQELSPIGNTR